MCFISLLPQGEKTMSLYPLVEKTGMGKPPFKASDGGRLEILWVTKNITQSDLQHGSGT